MGDELSAELINSYPPGAELMNRSFPRNACECDQDSGFVFLESSIVLSRFDVSWPEVKKELLAVGGDDNLCMTTGVLSEVSSGFKGDLWGPSWIALTLSTILFMSSTISSTFKPLLWIWAVFLIVAYNGLVTLFLKVFSQKLIRDPTFYAVANPELKWLSLSGYALAGPTVVIGFDTLVLGLILKVDRNSLGHFIFLTALSYIPYCKYVNLRYPVKRVGGFEPPWDKRRAFFGFWGVITPLYCIFIALVEVSF